MGARGQFHEEGTKFQGSHGPKHGVYSLCPMHTTSVNSKFFSPLLRSCHSGSTEVDTLQELRARPSCKEKAAHSLEEQRHL